ncbi:isoprenyl transferase [Lactococcus hodotermopsidis]|uniref:Isoprenyl transferase n=1 Tax=Pseudolactococcus hodotermopsidis TaxID=2709157 RepID=A0A6A0BAB2_9LACT|nr:isoprenyl transferase [Lactococcus hodotermopsidis]GFH41585.1 isoprenyl transferase [Lactococcus hodotermopsidis]
MTDSNEENQVPKHIAVIMDGNGRWAQNQGKKRLFGHKAGMDNLKTVAIHAQRRGVKILTVYAFSTENWQRPAAEVKFIMSLPIDFYEKFVPTLKKENIQIRMIGKRDGVPKATLKAIDKAMSETIENTGLILNIALNYGGQAEILEATRLIGKDIISGLIGADEITPEVFESKLATAIFPKDYRNPDFVIRTSGEHRLSNFLLWQTAYSELYFTETLWPDFNETALDLALDAFAQRERRYGGIKK